jgi:hypothetical protein
MTSRFAKKGIVRVRSAIIAMTVYFFLVYIAFELSVPLFPSRPAQLAMAGIYASSFIILTIGGSIWFLVFGGKILKTMKVHKDLPKRDKAVRRLSRFVRGASISMIVTVVILTIMISINFVSSAGSLVLFITSNLIQRMVQAGFCIFLLAWYRTKLVKTRSEGSSSFKTSTSIPNMSSTNSLQLSPRDV